MSSSCKVGDDDFYACFIYWDLRMKAIRDADRIKYCPETFIGFFRILSGNTEFKEALGLELTSISKGSFWSLKPNLYEIYQEVKHVWSLHESYSSTPEYEYLQRVLTHMRSVPGQVNKCSTTAKPDECVGTEVERIRELGKPRQSLTDGHPKLLATVSRCINELPLTDAVELRKFANSYPYKMTRIQDYYYRTIQLLTYGPNETTRECDSDTLEKRKNFLEQIHAKGREQFGMTDEKQWSYDEVIDGEWQKAEDLGGQLYDAIETELKSGNCYNDSEIFEMNAVIGWGRNHMLRAFYAFAGDALIPHGNPNFKELHTIIANGNKKNEYQENSVLAAKVQLYLECVYLSHGKGNTLDDIFDNTKTFFDFAWQNIQESVEPKDVEFQKYIFGMYIALKGRKTYIKKVLTAFIPTQIQKTKSLYDVSFEITLWLRAQLSTNHYLAELSVKDTMNILISA